LSYKVIKANNNTLTASYQENLGWPVPAPSWVFSCSKRWWRWQCWRLLDLRCAKLWQSNSPSPTYRQFLQARCLSCCL